MGETLCGTFWGPNNRAGACDGIMVDFCNANPTDPLCNCITVGSNAIPQPECFDVRCTTTNAMRLSTQLNNDCNSTFIQCNQFFNLSPEAKNNLVNGNTIAQNCNANINSSGDITATGAANSTLGIGAIIGIVIAIVVVLIIVITVPVVLSQQKKKREEAKKKKAQQNGSSLSSSSTKTTTTTK